MLQVPQALWHPPPGLSSYPIPECHCVEMTGEQAETRERRRANVKTLRGIFLSLETHSQIRGDPAYRQENDLMLKLIQLPTPKKSFSKADLALIMLQIQKMHIGTISLAEA